MAKERSKADKPAADLMARGLLQPLNTEGPTFGKPLRPGPLPLERVTGIEPALSAWEADVLPLNYTRACEQGLVKLTNRRACTVSAQTWYRNR